MRRMSSNHAQHRLGHLRHCPYRVRMRELSSGDSGDGMKSSKFRGRRRAGLDQDLGIQCLARRQPRVSSINNAEEMTHLKVDDCLNGLAQLSALGAKMISMYLRNKN